MPAIMIQLRSLTITKKRDIRTGQVQYAGTRRGTSYTVAPKGQDFVGIRNRGLSEKMQLDEGLTLEKAVKLARESEAVRKQPQLREGEMRFAS